MPRLDFRYSISDERLIAYSRVPLEERLRWLEELAVFTQMWRAAPRAPGSSPNRNGDDAPTRR